MKRILIPTFILALCGCSTIEPNREIASTQNKSPIFKDVTSTSNIGTQATSSIIIGDFNNDGLVDFIAHKKLYKNISSEGKIRFEDVTSKVNLQSLDGNPIFIDVNNDGLLDIMTTKGQLFLQNNNKFSDVGKRYGLNFPSDTYTISFGDLNKDGLPDLLVGRSETYENNVFKFVPPKVYLNVVGLTFRDISTEQGMLLMPAYTRGIVWADYDNNQTPDIYYANYRLRQNFLFKVRNGNMIENATTKGAAGVFDNNRYMDPHYKQKFGPRYGHTIGAVWADLNNDGNLDLWVSNLVHKYVGPSNKGGYDIRGYVCDDSKIYKNTGAPHYNFVDMRATSNIPLKPMGDYSKFKGDELWSHSTAADFDNDGLLDMYVTQVYNLPYAHSLLFRNLGNFKFENLSQLGPKVFDTYAGAWADFDNDGKMDLIVSGRDKVDAEPRMRIFKNIYQTKNNYLRVKLTGTKSGRNAVTTQIRAFHDKGVFLRQIDGVTGTHNQQNDPVIHFGLGKVEKINRLEILWSSGKKQTITNVNINSTLSIVER